MPGIKEVARYCGVSPATVSQVLGGGTRPVSEHTRTRVVQAARVLGYRPNAIARGLVKKRMNTLGVVIQHAAQSAHTNPALGTILDGILTVGTRRHQHITLVTYRNWEEAREAAPTLCDGRCDGVLLVAPPLDDVLLGDLSERGLPFVVIGAHTDDPRVSCVDVDNVAGAARVVEYLLEQGHRRIGLISAIAASHQFVVERIQGFQEALNQAGVAAPSDLIRMDEDIAASVRNFLSRPPHDRPTALFCINDDCALHAMHHLAERGLRVPEDISVAGFDDVPAAALAHSPLTTLRQPIALAGERAAEMLLARLDDSALEAQKLFLPTELIVRRSVRHLDY